MEETPMELTKNELEIANRHIAKRERELAQWPRKRWLLLVVYSVAMLVGGLIILSGQRSINDDQSMEAEMMKITTILEARHQIVTLSLLQMAAGFLPFISGLTMVTIVILRWNGGERDALICKLLRAKLRELEQSAARKS
jgi:hypothetical protein